MGIFKRSTDIAERPRTFLGRLARDVRGNTFAIMGISIIPLAGMVGGGLDLSRMYILKTRMQHACDAGSLAGRRAMGGGVWSYNSYYPRTQAEQFFDANFDWTKSGNKPGEYGSYNVERTFTESAGKVTGVAKAMIPMTIMKVFRQPDEEIKVTCDAEMRLPNTDVMFVLDNTGSMGDSAGSDSMTKMQALKVAVKCFYEIVARLDTDATCTTGTPSGGTGNEVQIRFGFVPYSSNVNVGKLLPTAWFADSWKYQTREAIYTTQNNGTAWVQTGAQVISATPMSLTGVPYNLCNDATAEAYGYNTTTGYTYSNNNNRRTYDKTVTNVTNWTATNGGTCSATQTKTRYTEDKQNQTTQVFQQWKYAQLPVNVSLLKNGTSWNDSFQWPIGSGGSNKTIRWGGCIEERSTVKQSSYDPIPSGAKDLDIDLTPTTDVATQWGMVLPDVISTRGWNYNSFNSTTDYGNSSGTYCPTEAKKLQPWPDASAFDDYVDSLQATGNTYHDIGLIWGARLASPTGLFASENAYTSKGGEIERHIIFMTDGDTNTGTSDYTAYGIPRLDRRTTPGSGEPSSGDTDNQVDARFAALCKKIKNTNNYTLWVITFGSVSTDTVSRMTTCATPGRYFHASNAASLQSTFKSIADQISMLRLTN